MEFKELTQQAMINDISEFLNIHPKTLRRWIRQNSAPEAARHALAPYAGNMPNWEGFKFDGDHLITPDGDRYHKNTIKSLDYQIQLARQIGRETAEEAQLKLVWSNTG